MGWADTDNPTADAMTAVLKHPRLLALKFLDDQQIAQKLFQRLGQGKLPNVDVLRNPAADTPSL